MKSYALPSVSSLLHYCGLQCPPIQGREKCCFVLHDSRLLGLLCYSEDRRCLFLLKVGELPMDRTTSNRENSTFKIKRFYLKKKFAHLYLEEFHLQFWQEISYCRFNPDIRAHFASICKFCDPVHTSYMILVSQEKHCGKWRHWKITQMNASSAFCREAVFRTDELSHFPAERH
jgi:hypothetical protein